MPVTDREFVFIGLTPLREGFSKSAFYGLPFLTFSARLQTLAETIPLQHHFRNGFFPLASYDPVSEETRY